jgi:N,N'-diacetyllegionaminate synthase
MINKCKFPKTLLHDLYGRENINGPFVLADLGLTNGGCLSTALELVKIAGELGVDAVKFQMLDADELINNKEVEYTYPTILEGSKTENMVKMFKHLEFNDREWGEIKFLCEKLNLGLIITSHVMSAVDRIEPLNLPVNKICTWSLSHWQMIERLASNGKPLIIDTGTINTDDLRELETFYRNAGGGEIIILFDFHTKDLSDRNFLAIKTLINSGFTVGYTPQGREDWLDFMSIGLGASIIEKRLTLSRTRPMNGHWKAHEPSEFAEWIRCVRDCAQALGEPVLTPTKDDLEAAKRWYKSAFLNQDVCEGQVILNEHFTFKRPGHGISSKEVYVKWLGNTYIKPYVNGQLFEG